MNKSFRSIDDQIRILNARGVSTTPETRMILMREGYYAVVNGYKLPFIDVRASERAEDDRFLSDTSFDDIYALFRFDRDLRALVFRHVMTVEATMRSILSYCFCEVHRGTEDYLRRGCYTTPREYLRGEDEFEGDLDWMINTLEHHARGVEDEMTTGDVRVSHYRNHYDGVPLWVLFNELTFGNLKYFYALMRRGEQVAACDRVWEACGRTGDSPITRKGMLSDLDEIIAVRNICAHEERLYNYASDSVGDIDECLLMLRRYLTEQDFTHLIGGVKSLVDEYSTSYERVAQALDDAGLLGVGR